MNKIIPIIILIIGILLSGCIDLSEPCKSSVDVDDTDKKSSVTAISSTEIPKIINKEPESKLIINKFYKIRHTTRGINYHGWIVWNDNEYVFRITTHRGNGYIEGINTNCSIIEYGVSEEFGCDITDTRLLKIFIDNAVGTEIDVTRENEYDPYSGNEQMYCRGYRWILEDYNPI